MKGRKEGDWQWEGRGRKVIRCKNKWRGKGRGGQNELPPS